MFKIIAFIGIGVVVIVAGILVYATTQPDDFQVRRSAAINAPPDRIFDLINDFHRWSAWSPYEKLDPAMQRTFGGAPNGKGAVYEWEGNNKVGKGRMEIVDAAPPSKVVINLDFIKPFEGHNTAEFTLEPRGEATNVTWAMHGPRPYVAKVMCLFFNLDNMIGKDFETGLANLKSATENRLASALPVSPRP